MSSSWVVKDAETVVVFGLGEPGLRLVKKKLMGFVICIEILLIFVQNLNTQTMEGLTQQDISILKYYKEGNELCGFEGVHNNLNKLGYLNDDLELTSKGYQFIEEYPNWNSVKTFNNKTYVKVRI